MLFSPRLVADAPYGAYELKSWYQPNLARAMALVGIMVGALWFGYWMYEKMTFVPTSTTNSGTETTIGDWPIDPPTPITIVRAGTQAPSVKRPKVGIPVAVMDYGDSAADNQLATRDDLGTVSAGGIDFGNPGSAADARVGKGSFPAPDEFIKVEEPPRFAVKQVPVYPELARRAGLEGTVVVKVLVDAQGMPRKALIVEESGCHCGFEQSAIDAVMKSVFTPAIQNGHPIAIWVTFPFNYRLK